MNAIDVSSREEESLCRAIHIRIAPKLPFRSYTTMDVGHNRLPGSQRDGPFFRPCTCFSSLPGKSMHCLEKVNRTQSQNFKFFLFGADSFQSPLRVWMFSALPKKLETTQRVIVSMPSSYRQFFKSLERQWA